MEKTKILFLMENLNSGGAERVLVNLVNHLDPSMFDITVMTLFSEGVNFPNLRPHIHKVCRHAQFIHGISYIMRFFSSRFLYRHYVGDDSYDIVVGYMTGIPTKIAAGAIHSKRIGWLHGNMHYVIPSQKLYWSRKHLRRTYERFDAVFGCAQTVTESFLAQIGASCPLVQTVYNVNDTNQILQDAQMEVVLPFQPEEDTPVFSTMGTLLPVKGYERLLSVCKRLKNENFAFRLLILGDGPLREKLELQIQSLGLQETVYLLGYQKNPYPFLANSQVFVCSSLSEGLSTAVSESVVLGCAVLSTDVSGAREVLGDQDEFGKIVSNDEESLYEGMRLFLENPKLIAHYHEKAKERASFFAVDYVVACNAKAILSVTE